ncbi:uncharacterized protein BDR25DRAFT_355824 [Lindgomyces ingoldianus]|uniref:Uncharacterized protein n=1 Tax=Lindgomyces ingoldianus TaxID=673940 RepID=A0ACB6QTA5_9PLEO|nr:uncharacterized protein BDR25DRAFT_355824 [Lindgomyces ingoldianus]KAF2470115.1 hypothetical protein BDR25DRAFT_355824 [Lindgomyces ingoldianus]
MGYPQDGGWKALSYMKENRISRFQCALKPGWKVVYIRCSVERNQQRITTTIVKKNREDRGTLTQSYRVCASMFLAPTIYSFNIHSWSSCDQLFLTSLSIFSVFSISLRLISKSALKLFRIENTLKRPSRPLCMLYANSKAEDRSGILAKNDALEMGESCHFHPGTTPQIMGGAIMMSEKQGVAGNALVNKRFRNVIVAGLSQHRGVGVKRELIIENTQANSWLPVLISGVPQHDSVILLALDSISVGYE